MDYGKMCKFCHGENKGDVECPCIAIEKKHIKERFAEIETIETLGGNTKTPKVQGNQLKKWVFTLNNYSEQDILNILETFVRYCDKYGFQTEKGENGTPHLQGAIWLKKAMRWSELKLSLNIHWEKMKSDVGSNDYVQKEESYTGRRWNFGLTPPPKPLKIISKLFPWQQGVLDIYNTEPDDRLVYWFWENKGNTGKSAFVKYMVKTHNVLFCNGGKTKDLINLVFNQDMNATKCIIWDLPRENEGFVSSSTIEAVKNGMVCNTKFETGVKLFNSPHVFIFSNFPPASKEGLSTDRWVVREIGKDI